MGKAEPRPFCRSFHFGCLKGERVSHPRTFAKDSLQHPRVSAVTSKSQNFSKATLFISASFSRGHRQHDVQLSCSRQFNHPIYSMSPSLHGYYCQHSSVAITYASLWVLLQLTQDSKEPPLVSATVPFISPILGMVKWSMGLYTHMRSAWNFLLSLVSRDPWEMPWYLGTCTINVGRLQTSCPTLVSTYQEVFRVHGMANSVCVAVEDYMLDGKYLIKKGGMVMIPARVQHYLRDVWGGSVEFNLRRFIRNKTTATIGEDEARPNPVAFRGFGGGTTLCPGRHFATSEILVFTAMLLLQFDLVPITTTGGGDLHSWILPSTRNSSQAEAMEQPDHDIDIQLCPRVGPATKWRISFEGHGDVALVAEDLSDLVSKIP